MRKMAKTFRDLNALENSLKARIEKAVALTQKEINDVLQKHINAYYDDYEPKVYDRQYVLRDMSIVEPRVIRKGNSFVCEIGFSQDYLNYKYPGNPDWGGNVIADGDSILYWNNEFGLHGGTVEGKKPVRIWSDFIEEIGGEFGMLSILYKNLKKCGIPLY